MVYPFLTCPRAAANQSTPQLPVLDRQRSGCLEFTLTFVRGCYKTSQRNYKIKLYHCFSRSSFSYWSQVLCFVYNNFPWKEAKSYHKCTSFFTFDRPNIKIADRLCTNSIAPNCGQLERAEHPNLHLYIRELHLLCLTLERVFCD